MVPPSSCNFRYQPFLVKFPFQLQIHPLHTHFFFFKSLQMWSDSSLNTNLSKENQFEATLSFKVSSQHKWDTHELCISENFTEAFSYFVSVFSHNMSLHSSKRLLGHKSKFSFSFLPFLPFSISFLLSLCLSFFLTYFLSLSLFLSYLSLLFIFLPSSSGFVLLK